MESLNFQRLPGSFSFSHSASSWSSSTSSDLTSKQKSRKHYGYHGSSCVPVLFIYLHMGAWVVKIKVFFLLRHAPEVLLSSLQQNVESQARTVKNKQSQGTLCQAHSLRIRPKTPPVSSSPHADLQSQQKQLNLCSPQPRARAMKGHLPDRHGESGHLFPRELLGCITVTGQ